MPYRRLPNTDKARIRSLEAAVNTMKYSLGYYPVLSPTLFTKAEKELAKFKAASDRYNLALSKQVNYSKSELYQTRLKNAKMYVTHFLTVLNMCFQREELKDADREFYSWDKSLEMPELSSDIQVIRWGERAIKGERERTAKRGIPIYNPTVAKVQVHYDLFKEMYLKHAELKQQTDESLMVVSLLRPQTDAVILEVWNSIENYFSNLTGSEKLEKCREYGVIYYFRSSEKAD